MRRRSGSSSVPALTKRWRAPVTKEVKDALFASTQRAGEAGVFGAPTWIVDGKELFWGQDRIVLVERALRA